VSPVIYWIAASITASPSDMPPSKGLAGIMPSQLVRVCAINLTCHTDFVMVLIFIAFPVLKSRVLSDVLVLCWFKGFLIIITKSLIRVWLSSRASGQLNRHGYTVDATLSTYNV